jgi:hypothetical protein
MKPEQEIVAALRALSATDRVAEAPPEVEVRLRVAYRASMARRKRMQAVLWMSCAAAAAIVVTALLWRGPQTAPKRIAVQAEQPENSAEAPVVAKMPEQLVRRGTERRPPREIFTEFFPLMEAPPPVDHGELVRVSLPASAMRTVGLPVREDRLSDPVQADVLVSEEGLATAIRFVKTSQ